MKNKRLGKEGRERDAIPSGMHAGSTANSMKGQVAHRELHLLAMGERERDR